jgi:broad-specificity NMP kinase
MTSSQLKIVKLNEIINELKHYAEQQDLNTSHIVSSDERTFFDDDVIVDDIILEPDCMYFLIFFELS